MESWKLIGPSHELSFLTTYSHKSLKIELIYDAVKYKTDLYDKSILVVRRGSAFEIEYQRFDKKPVKTDKISVKITAFSKSKQIKTTLDKNKDHDWGFQLLTGKNHPEGCTVVMNVDVNTAVGFYNMSLIDDGETIGKMFTIYMIFNPLHNKEDVYTNDISLIKEYLLNSRIKIYCGSENFHYGKAYNLDQFTLEAIAVCGYFINRMSIEDRRDAVLVSRAFSAYVNANDERGLIIGNWKEVTEGTSSTAWTNALDIYKEYLTSACPVKWGQCFVFSMLLTSMCRNVGIVSKSVSGFLIGHDNEKDGYITMHIDEETSDLLPRSETLWNFHAWNNVLLNRQNISTEFSSADLIKITWQHLDGTPQERSQGIYQCGPYPVELLRRHIHKSTVPYDGTPVYHSINYISRYITLDKNKKEINRREEKEGCRLIVSTNLEGQKVDITNEYKSFIDKVETSEREKMQVVLDAPASVYLQNSFPFEITVTNASQNFPTILSLSLELVDASGRNILAAPVHTSRAVFLQSSYSLQETVAPVNIDKIVDLSMGLLRWNIQCFDQHDKTLDTKKKTTVILPCFLSSFMVLGYRIKLGKHKIVLEIENKLHVKVKNCKIEVLIKEEPKRYTTIRKVFPADSKEMLTFEISFDRPGYFMLQAYMFCSYFNGKIGKKYVLVSRR